MIVTCIVEGDGEVAALPVLLRRLTEHIAPGKWIDLPQPIRVRRDRFLNRAGEFERFVSLAVGKAQGGRVLILLDADDDCPVELANEIARRAALQMPVGQLAVVVAVKEFEAWFVAVADSLSGTRGFEFEGDVPDQPEEIRGAKEWISSRVSAGRYHEVADQASFCARMNIDSARKRSRSFRKLYEEWSAIVAAAT